jgi:hypothetical protein
VRLRCYLLFLLRIHRSDCEHCARAKAGGEMHKRLEELNWRTQQHSPDHGDHSEVIEVIDSKPGEVLSPPISGKAQEEKEKAS